VDYTQRRHVRRIPGAAPGLVTYSQGRTIRVAPRRPDPGTGEE
jgi:predicted ribosome quality control (RQC) complex YloA/Tae2 family protein